MTTSPLKLDKTQTLIVVVCACITELVCDFASSSWPWPASLSSSLSSCLHGSCSGHQPELRRGPTCSSTVKAMDKTMHLKLHFFFMALAFIAFFMAGAGAAAAFLAPGAAIHQISTSAFQFQQFALVNLIILYLNHINAGHSWFPPVRHCHTSHHSARSWQATGNDTRDSNGVSLICHDCWGKQTQLQTQQLCTTQLSAVCACVCVCVCVCVRARVSTNAQHT